MADPKRFELGETVTFTRTLHRRRDHHSGERTWEESLDQTPRSGMIVGHRTLSNGTAERDSDTDDYGNTSWWIDYHPKERFPAYIVAPSLRAKHVLVLPEHIEPAEGNDDDA